MSTAVGKYIGLLLASREQAHVFHLTTRSFAAHKALQTYYEEIVPLLDTYAETYMGKARKRIVIPVIPTNRRNVTNARLAQKYFIRLAQRISLLKLPKNQTLENIRQEIDALIRQTVYMLSLK
jgi:hypothetical protein